MILEALCHQLILEYRRFVSIELDIRIIQDHRLKIKLASLIVFP